MEPHERDKLMLAVGEMRGDIKHLISLSQDNRQEVEKIDARVAKLEARYTYALGAFAVISVGASLIANKLTPFIFGG